MIKKRNGVNLNFKKFAAITIVALMFIIFFEIGFVAFYKQTPEVKYDYKYFTNTVYVTNKTPESALAYGIGIHDDNKTGELVEINVTIEPGNGRVFFDSTFHSYGTDLQDSMSSIIQCAETTTNESLDNLDIKINLRSEAHTVEGTSGGAALGIGLIAALENKTIRSDAAITGTLDEYCRIGSIAELSLKIKIAEDNGLKKIVVPNSQCDEVNEANATIDVVCVKNASEALKEMTE